jgi:hypothetical protein
MLLLWVKIIPPHTVAIDVEPSEPITPELTQTVYGETSSGGKITRRAFSASGPTKLKQKGNFFSKLCEVKLMIFGLP